MSEPTRQRTRRTFVRPDRDPAPGRVRSLRERRREKAGVVQEPEVVRRLTGPDVTAPSIEERAQSIPRLVALWFGRIRLPRVVDDVEGQQRVGSGVQECVRRDDLHVGAEDLFERPQRVVPPGPSGEHRHLGCFVQLRRLVGLVRLQDALEEHAGSEPGGGERGRVGRVEEQRAGRHLPGGRAREGLLGHHAVEAVPQETQDRPDLADRSVIAYELASPATTPPARALGVVIGVVLGAKEGSSGISSTSDPQSRPWLHAPGGAYSWVIRSEMSWPALSVV